MLTGPPTTTMADPVSLLREPITLLRTKPAQCVFFHHGHELSLFDSRADKAVLASSGFQADVKALQKHLAAKHLIYQHQHNKQMSCPAMAQLLSNTLYYKRFFPYYAFNVLGGLDSEGKGCVFTYDAVGSYERVGYSSQGSGSTLIIPFLDNQLKSPSPLLLPAVDAVTPLSEAEAIDLVKTVFASATERDIYTGDRLEIVVLNADGTRYEYMELRKD
ncbi:N-terminal nucleophile aminohydrolases superfamily protein [Prunus dulcis]|uniref:N-terminal nucleophile aminohydrolases superfamily protein n=1 Tax=Prunus dulcis TaxID=3755 RepID=A0A4Y1QZY9_PRUDU|nr:N-terminal nucleophile aminohydrolases superfamily protein [Prunus dulcis]